MCNSQFNNISSIQDVAIFQCAGCGAPFWSAKDLCNFLEFSNPDQVIAELDPDLKDERILEPAKDESKASKILKMPEKVEAVNIKGLFSLILRSRSHIAKKFQRWIIEDVLFEILLSEGPVHNIDFGMIEELEEMGLLPVGN
jgi:prophage antirepressor-like protein